MQKISGDINRIMTMNYMSIKNNLSYYCHVKSDEIETFADIL